MKRPPTPTRAARKMRSERAGGRAAGGRRTRDDTYEPPRQGCRGALPRRVAGATSSPRSKCFIVGVGAALYSGAAHILTRIALDTPPAGRSYAELNVMNPLYGSFGPGLGRSGATGVGGAAHFHTALPPLHILLLFALQPLMVGVVAAAAEYMVAGTGGLLQWWMLADAFADTLTLLFNSTNVSLAAFTLIVAGSSADYAIRPLEGGGEKSAFLPTIQWEMIGKMTTGAPADTRFFQILLSLVKAFTLLNVLNRRRDESGKLIAEPVDLEYALTVFSKIAETHRLGVTPLALQLFEGVKPALQGAPQGLRRNELGRVYAKTHHPIDQGVLKDLLRQLVSAGLLEETTDPLDRRFRVYKLPIRCNV